MPDEIPRLERFRIWSERWNSAFSIGIGLFGISSILIAAVGLGFQYKQLIDAEKDTAREFELMRMTLSELSTQTTLQVELNTRSASERFFERRNDPEYEHFLVGLEKIDVEDLSDDERNTAEQKLEAGFEHFGSTWQEVLHCREPHCKVFDMLHSHNVRDICTIASRDADRLIDIIAKSPEIETKDEAYERVRGTVLGSVMCHCPEDWTSWGLETSPYCWEYGRD